LKLFEAALEIMSGNGLNLEVGNASSVTSGIFKSEDFSVRLWFWLFFYLHLMHSF